MAGVDRAVDEIDLLVGLIEASSVCRRLLADEEVDRESLVRSAAALRAAGFGSAQPLTALEGYGRDLTELACRGELDPVVGRETEIRRLVQVLCRRTKNNPVLIGEPGVGKTAVVEALAQRISVGDVPDQLRRARLFALDIGALVAGSKFRGEFEQRLKSVLDAIAGSSGQVITFVDEMHTLVTAGGADGAISAGNLVKPLLARGQLRLVGATTLDEYREHVERDPALERRFQPVFVEEPSVQESIAILRGLKEWYEAHHQVRITDRAVVAAAVLSHRYVSGRFLPDKAIDVLDEAASLRRIEAETVPAEIDAIAREVRSVEIERSALRTEHDEMSRRRLTDIESRLGDLRATLTAFESASGLEPDVIPIDRAAGRVVEMEMEVDEERVAAVVSSWTGVPTARLIEQEAIKLSHIERDLARRVAGQEHATRLVANSIRRSRSGVSPPERPIGSFLFVGPTGVGKTELALALAELLFDDARSLIRIDMSEYRESHTAARLLGAPPGYVGYEQGGQLTEVVRRRPYSVILFDEVEKAHPEVTNVLLQLLGEGRLTDGRGRVIDFRNTLVIMTSNIGSSAIADPSLSSTEIDDHVREVVQNRFRPEFLNRLDATVVFSRLGVGELRRIVDMRLETLSARLDDRKIVLTVTRAAREWLAAHGYDPTYGARPLERLIQTEIEDVLAQRLVAGEIVPGGAVEVGMRGDRLTFQRPYPGRSSAEDPTGDAAKSDPIVRGNRA